MHQAQQLLVRGGTDRKRVESVVETLATLGSQGESLAEVAHDARNMVTALGLYCDLLDEPGVLAIPFTHYGSELKLVAAASRRLVEKLVALDTREVPQRASSGTSRGRLAGERTIAGTQPRAGQWEWMPTVPIANLAAELFANRNLLSALVGPSIAVTVDAERGAQPVKMTGEDLTRILVNLVKNAAEAMAGSGRIHLSLKDSLGESENSSWLTLNIEDNGPGIDRAALDRIFEAGHTTRSNSRTASGGAEWRAAHRGLGLSITRSIVEAAGGTIHAANRDPAGACFQIELPVWTR